MRKKKKKEEEKREPLNVSTFKQNAFHVHHVRREAFFAAVFVVVAGHLHGVCILGKGWVRC